MSVTIVERVNFDMVNTVVKVVRAELSGLNGAERIAVLSSLRLTTITTLASVHDIDDDTAAELVEQLEEQFTNQLLPPREDISPDGSSNN